MSSWDMGYNSERIYEHNYFREFSPVNIKYMLALAGIEFDIDHDFKACELGFGNGMNINITAASTDSQWWGTDFNASQVNHALNYAKKAGNKIEIRDLPFHEFAALDLPKFDYICLHGIWSWISKENQQVIVDFINTHLNVGGVVYISYNIKPGFALFEPFRYLAYTMYRDYMVKDSNDQAKMSDLSTFFSGLIDVNPSYLKAVPQLVDRVKSEFSTKQFAYISGEYFNEHWHLMHFSEMASEMEKAKLDYVGTATILDHIVGLCLTPEQLDFIAPYAGTPAYEDLRDLIECNSFRRDLYMRGPHRLDANQRRANLDTIPFIMVCDKSDVHYNIISKIGRIELSRELFEPIVNILADYKPRTAAEIREALPKLDVEEVDEALQHLVCLGYIQPCQSLNKVTKEVTKRCRSINEYSLSKADEHNQGFLASPVLGGAFTVPQFTMKLISVYMNAKVKNDAERKKVITDILNSACTDEVFADVLYAHSPLATSESSLFKRQQETEDALDEAIAKAQSPEASEVEKASLAELIATRENWEKIKSTASDLPRMVNGEQLAAQFCDSYIKMLRGLQIID